jgi:hypothetical protein
MRLLSASLRLGWSTNKGLKKHLWLVGWLAGRSSKRANSRHCEGKERSSLHIPG